MGSVVSYTSNNKEEISLPNGKLIFFSGIALMDFRTDEDQWQTGGRDIEIVIPNSKLNYNNRKILPPIVTLSAIEANRDDHNGWAIDEINGYRYSLDRNSIIIKVKLVVRRGEILRIGYKCEAFCW